MSEPTQTCTECGTVEAVQLYGSGFPPDAAKRRLRKRCNAADCPSKPQYRAGVRFGGPVVAASPKPTKENR